MKNELIIYHGSENIIEFPEYGKGKPYNDYGRGFYCTEHIDLAKEWACDANHGGYANKSFKDILAVMPFSKLTCMHYPYHEADEMKTIEIIVTYFKSESALKTIRKKRKLTQDELALLSGVNVRSIRAYEQGTNDITKAQVDTLLMLAGALDCSVEDLLN